jgi:hypothetical protein
MKIRFVFLILILFIFFSCLSGRSVKQDSILTQDRKTFISEFIVSIINRTTDLQSIVYFNDLKQIESIQNKVFKEKLDNNTLLAQLNVKVLEKSNSNYLFQILINFGFSDYIYYSTKIDNLSNIDIDINVLADLKTNRVLDSFRNYLFLTGDIFFNDGEDIHCRLYLKYNSMKNDAENKSGYLIINDKKYNIKEIMD